MSVRRVKLSEVVSINPKTDASTFDLQDQVAFIAMADVSEQGQVANIQVRVFDEVKKGYTCFQNGDVLLAKITPCFENGKATQVTGLFSEIGFGSTEFHVLRPSKQINGRFLFYLVWNINFRRLGELRMTGSAGQKRVPAKFLEEYEINLPSLEEQKRIAAILDKADSLRRKRAQAIALADDFLRATFLDMFGDPVTNPKGWAENCKLSDVAEIVSGITKGRVTKGEELFDVPYLAVSNVQDRFIKLDVVKRIEATKDEIERYKLLKDDLLLTEGGDPDKLGRGALWDGSIENCIHQNHVFRVRVNSELILPVFLNWLVGSQRGKSYFLSAAKQTTGIASINMRQLKAFPLILPPVSLQAAFSEMVEKTAQLLVKMKRQSLAELQSALSLV